MIIAIESMNAENASSNQGILQLMSPRSSTNKVIANPIPANARASAAMKTLSAGKNNWREVERIYPINPRNSPYRSL
ncbi:MAG: hypothetical protein ACP5LE_08065 [Thermoplasmata archaeon]